MIRHAGDSIGFFSMPCIGEVECGDECFIRRDTDRVFLALIDGAGHGASAKEVADLARKTLGGQPPCADLERCMGVLHDQLRGTRGAAVAMVNLLWNGCEWSGNYTAVGDVALSILGTCTRQLPVSDGIVGVAMRSKPLFPIILHRGERLLLASDGVRPGFAVDLPGTQLPPKALDLARKIVLLHQREHDDSSCLVFVA